MNHEVNSESTDVKMKKRWALLATAGEEWRQVRRVRSIKIAWSQRFNRRTRQFRRLAVISTVSTTFVAWVS
ncbi:MAG: hypothetical protein SFV81_27055 [Pirellulaceae bacterium]|nr:hypothetical protein [Pirellulaceae bacterium]